MIRPHGLIGNFEVLAIDGGYGKRRYYVQFLVKSVTCFVYPDIRGTKFKYNL